MTPVAAAFERVLREVDLRAPEMPYISNVTGTWITPAEATDPAYWVRHLLEPVRFGAGLAELGREAGRVLLEVGPGQSLSSLSLQRVFRDPPPGSADAPREEGRTALPTLRPSWERRPDQAFLLGTLGRLWLAGVSVDWAGFAKEERRRRVPLPTYPFERKRYWIESPVSEVSEAVGPHPRPLSHLPSTRPPGEGGALTDSSQAFQGLSPLSRGGEGWEMGEGPGVRSIATTTHGRPGLATPYVAPTTPTEAALAEVWQELLGVAPVGIHDSFFDLGGHSLMASQLVARLSARFGAEVPLVALFEAPTVAALAVRLHGAPEAQLETALPRRPQRDRAPLSFAQQRLWFVHHLAPESSAYNNPVAMRLRGPLDLAALTEALAEIERRHEVLRTRFPVEDGEPVQLIEDPRPVELQRIDLSHLAGEEGEAAARSALWSFVEPPFDLARRPPVRHLLARLTEEDPEEDHLFVTAMHHILWDEWSQGIFVRELATLYEAFRDGQPSPLPELPIQYGDWALWQREHLQGEVLEEHLSYWRARLDGAPRLLALPTDRPRPPVQTFRGATRAFAVSEELQRSLHAVSQRQGSTLFMTLLATFQALLGRYAGQEDVVVSTGTGGRDRVEAESLIGCFINILLLRADLGGGVSFDELLARTRESTLGAFAHQDVPFELLVDALQIERDPSTTPFAQAMLVLLNVPPVDLELRGLEVKGVRIDRQVSQFDLVLYLTEEGGRLGGQLEYNVDLFDEATVDRLLGHYRNLMERAAADPGRRIAEISLLSEAERRQAVEEWNATAEAFPRDACLHELFDAWADKQPEATGLIFGDEPFTYAELSRRANRLAHHLMRLGVRRGDRVGVSLEHAPEVVVSLLAVLKAGGAYMPLDPGYPQERLAAMLEEAGLSALLTQKRLAPRFSDVPTVLVDQDFAGAGDESPRTGVGPEDMVYMIFTSGSTGRPKGVLLDHRGRVNNFTDFNRRFRIGPGDAVLALSSLSFDMSAYDVLGTLAGGGTIVLPRLEELREPSRWAGLMTRHRVTIWHSVPAMLEMLVDSLEPRPEAAPRSLRLVLLGGDWIPVTLPDRLRALVPEAEVISLGGATEVSMDSTIFSVSAIDPAWKSIPYGVPMANQLAYILGPDGGPNPAGVAGELCLGGVGVGAGYFGRPELTAAKFVPDPFGSGDRLYRTGDLARWRSDGVLELLGRMDFQVKVRGFRIEPGEIVSALRQHPAVDDVVVLAREDQPGAKRLVAYLVPAPGVAVDVDEVRELARRLLPGYMVPSAFVVMETLPLTPNRKLDRKALPVPEEAATERELVPPRTALEQVLAGIWRDVLRVPDVGAFDHFFDLGGHSLAATRVVTQIQEVFLLEVPLRLLFESPVLAELAARLEDLAAREGVDAAGIAEVLADIQELPEEEVHALLAEEPG